MRTDIIKVKGDWQEVVDDCRSTVGKEGLGHEPSKSFKQRILVSEHSPIRDIIIKWRWPEIKSWIATHWVRHKWECFVKSQRPDRTGVPRGSQDALVSFTGEANVQQLIDTMRKRLCYQASPETRQAAYDLKAEIAKVQPEVAAVLVPNCVYRCGCPEMTECPAKFWARNWDKMFVDDIQDRYDAYNELFWKMRGEKE